MERNDEELLKRFYLLVKESFGRSPDPTGNHLRAAAQPEIHSLIKTGYDSVLTQTLSIEQ